MKIDRARLDEVDRKNVENWLRIPELVRQDCLRLLREVVPADVMGEMHEHIRRFGHFENMDHFGFGMWVRNHLRGVITDGELPGVKYDNGNEYRNWDDFYVGALYDLAGAL